MTITCQTVNLPDSIIWRKRTPSHPMPKESDFVCSRQQARQFLSDLTNSSEPQIDPNLFYLFSAEKRRVRITVLAGCMTSLPVK